MTRIFWFVAATLTFTAVAAYWWLSHVAPWYAGQ